MAHDSRADRTRLEREAARDRRARRDATRRNAAKGVGRNLEEAVRLIRAGNAFHDAFRAHR